MMVLIQKFDELEKASDNLRKTGYYDKWPSDYYEGTVKNDNLIGDIEMAKTNLKMIMKEGDGKNNESSISKLLDKKTKRKELGKT